MRGKGEGVNIMKKFCILVFMNLTLAPTLSGCVTQSPEKAQYTNISVQQAKEMIDKDDVFILDVRTQEEYNAGHIRNSTLILANNGFTRIYNMKGGITESTKAGYEVVK